MGWDLTLRCGKQEFHQNLPSTDIDLVISIRPAAESAVDTLFGGELGEPVVLPRLELQNSIDAIEELLRQRPDLVPRTYQFKLERFPIPGVPAGGFASRGVGGIKMPGDTVHSYYIRAGSDECVLVQRITLSNGKGQVVETRDLRQETSIQTASHGEIRIRSRQKSTTFTKLLKSLRKFLKECDGEQVTRTLS